MEDWSDPIMEEMRRIKRENDAMRAMMNPTPLIDRTLDDAVQMSRMAEDAMRGASIEDWMRDPTMEEIERIKEESDAKRANVNYMLPTDILIDPKTKALFDISEKLDEMKDSMKEPRINNFGVIAHEININNYTTINFLTALEEVVESKDIPEPQKKNILQKIKDLKDDPIVSSAGAGLFVEAVSRLFGG